MSAPRPLVTPGRLAGGALVIAAAYGLAHVAGLGAFLTALSGSLPPGGVSPGAAEAACVVYLALYAAVTLVAPILLLAAGILAALLRTPLAEAHFQTVRSSCRKSSRTSGARSGSAGCGASRAVAP